MVNFQLNRSVRDGQGMIKDIFDAEQFGRI